MVGRWVKLERERRQAAEQGRPDPREMEAEITAPSRRVRELEKENEFLGKASAFFAARAHCRKDEATTSRRSRPRGSASLPDLQAVKNPPGRPRETAADPSACSSANS